MVELKHYVIFKFYIPDYAIQSRPIPISIDLIKRRGWGWAVMRAAKIFLSRGLRPIGTIHDSHLELWEDGRITFSTKLKKLTTKQASWMRSQIGGKQARKIGWERRYRRQ